MKIGIIGTRGIPNHYGGFEQFAEYLSTYLVRNGHEVTVYNSHTHPYQQKQWNGVQIKHQFDPEDKIGTVGQFIYDLNCILDCRKQKFDVILQLGYTSSSIWGRFLPRTATIVTNMDGLEWKRSKYSKSVQQYLRYAEKLAVKRSDTLIADSIGIQEYLAAKYTTESVYIPYGSEVFTEPEPKILTEYQVEAYAFDMLIARLEPENSIETILSGVANAEKRRPFLVIGNHNTQYGKKLKETFKHVAEIKFIGTIYNINVLNNLRYFSNNYFHGHTVGGTNPSLLEAMGSGALISAHDNIFNKSILGDDAWYFTTKEEVSEILAKRQKADAQSKTAIQANLEKIRTTYSWNTINCKYEEVIRSSLKARTK